MYNGIGLQTTRGSGTSGYVQRNLSALRYRDERGHTGPKDSLEDRDGPAQRQPDKGILDHDRKRKVEIRCMELQDELEEQGLPDDEIEAKVSQLRETLNDSLNNNSSFGQSSHAETRSLRPSDVHALREAKAAETEKWKSAFGVRDDYQEGQGFSADYHLKLREERNAARQQRKDQDKARREAVQDRRRKEDEERRQFDDEIRSRRRQGDDRRSRSPPPRREENRGRDERPPSAGPSTSQRRSGKEREARSPSPGSPPPRRRRRDSLDSDSGRSRSPPPRRRRRAGSSSSASRSLSPSPPPRDREEVRRRTRSP